MASDLTKVLHTQYKAAGDASPHLLIVVDPADIRNWHYLIFGLDEPFAGGEYIFSAFARDGFPAVAPRFTFMTPNGVYVPGGPICISIGEFHEFDAPGKQGASGWRPALGMAGFAIEVVGSLICYGSLGGGVRIETTSLETKKKLARESADFNRSNFPDIVRLFDELCEARPDSEAVLNLRDARLRAQGLPVPARPAKSVPVQPPSGRSRFQPPPVRQLRTSLSPARPADGADDAARAEAAPPAEQPARRLARIPPAGSRTTPAPTQAPALTPVPASAPAHSPASTAPTTPQLKKKPAKAPAKAPAKTLAKTPAEAPAKTPAEAPTEAPVEAPTKALAKAEQTLAASRPEQPAAAQQPEVDMDDFIDEVCASLS